jgi:hypothetical protein
MCWYSSQTALSNLHIKFPDFTPLEFKAGCKKKRRVQRWCSALGDTDRYSLFWGDTSVNCQLFGRWKSRVPPTVFRDTSRLAQDRTALINLLLVYQCITHVDMAQKYSNVPFTKGLKRPNIYIYQMCSSMGIPVSLFAPYDQQELLKCLMTDKKWVGVQLGKVSWQETPSLNSLLAG